jgi:hypothetical protein
VQAERAPSARNRVPQGRDKGKESDNRKQEKTSASEQFEMGFVPSREEKGRPLKKYSTVPGRQIETSVVLADSKESTSFSARPIRFTYRNRLHGVRTENNAFWRKIS